jgi:hypothetical protein
MHLDLFEHPELIPTHVQSILDKHSGIDCTYGDCDKLVAALNEVGYTCDYSLDAEPFNLHKIESKDINKMNLLELEWCIDENQRLSKFYKDKVESGILNYLFSQMVALTTVAAAQNQIYHLKWILNRDKQDY